ncbi:transmembrane protein, putative, partial [Bodo saltans]
RIATKSRTISVDGSHPPGGGENRQLLVDSYTISVTRTRRNNNSDTHTISASRNTQTRSAMTPTPSFSCSSVPQFVVRAHTELFGDEHQFCASASTSSSNGEGSNSNMSTSFLSSSSSCLVAAALQRGVTQQLSISIDDISRFAFPLYVVLPFVLNATDWAVDMGTAKTSTTTNAPIVYLDNATLEQTRLRQLLEQQLSLAYPGQNIVLPRNGTTGAVVFRFDSTPPYGSVHTVQIGCFCGGRYLTTTLSMQWPDQAIIPVTTSQQVFTAFAAALGPFTGDPTSAAALALFSAMSCSGEAPSSTSLGAYFLSVFFSEGPAILALGNLGLTAAFFSLQLVACVIFHAAQRRLSAANGELRGSTSSRSSSSSSSAFFFRGPAILALGNLGLTAAFFSLQLVACVIFHAAQRRLSAVHGELGGSTSSHSSSSSSGAWSFDDSWVEACVAAQRRLSAANGELGGSTSSHSSSSSSSARGAWSFDDSWVEACGAVRGPAWSVLFMQFMLPGTVYGALVCLSSGEDVPLGAVALVCALLVFVMLFAALIYVVLPRAVYTEYPLPHPTGTAFENTLRLLPAAHWNPRVLVKGFGPLMASRCRRFCALTFADLTLTCLLAVATGLGVGTKGASCAYAPIIIAVLYFLYAVALVVLRPHRIPSDKVFAPISAAIFGVLCIMKYTESNTDIAQMLVSVVQVSQMLLRLWVSYREWQWKCLDEDMEEEVRAKHVNSGGGLFLNKLADDDDDDDLMIAVKSLSSRASSFAVAPTEMSQSYQQHEYSPEPHQQSMMPLSRAVEIEASNLAKVNGSTLPVGIVSGGIQRHRSNTVTSSTSTNNTAAKLSTNAVFPSAHQQQSIAPSQASQGKRHDATGFSDSDDDSDDDHRRPPSIASSSAPSASVEAPREGAQEAPPSRQIMLIRSVVAPPREEDASYLATLMPMSATLSHTGTIDDSDGEDVSSSLASSSSSL